MAKRNISKSSFEIMPSVAELYHQMVSRYGIRMAVSAGILALSKLTPEEREVLVDEVAADERYEKNIQTAVETICSVEPAEIIKFCDAEDSAALAKLRAALAPEQPCAKSKKG